LALKVKAQLDYVSFFFVASFLSLLALYCGFYFVCVLEVKFITRAFVWVTASLYLDAQLLLLQLTRGCLKVCCTD